MPVPSNPKNPEEVLVDLVTCWLLVPQIYFSPTAPGDDGVHLWCS